MFSDELQQWEWDETTAAISSKTAADVERALSREHLDIDDFMALILRQPEPISSLWPEKPTE